jgi:hypothetical protein
MFGDQQGLRLGNVEDLAQSHADRIRCGKFSAAIGAGWRQMVDDGIRSIRLSQGRTCVPRLSATLPASLLA